MKFVFTMLAALSLVVLVIDAKNYSAIIGTFVRPYGGVSQGGISQCPDGTTLAASGDFKISAKEASKVCAGFRNASEIMPTFKVANQEYTAAGADERVIFGRRTQSGIVCASTKTDNAFNSGFVCGVWTGNAPSYSWNAAVTVVKLADYLSQVDS